MPTAEEKISELTLATKMGDVADILALIEEIRQHRTEWFGEEAAADGQRLEDAIRQSFDAVVEISESQIHAALSRRDIAAARNSFRYVEQVAALAPNYADTATKISERIQAAEQQPAEQQPKRYLSVRVCQGCGESNTLDAILCKACGLRISKTKSAQGKAGGGLTITPAQSGAPTKTASKMPVLVGIGVALLVVTGLGAYFISKRGGTADNGSTASTGGAGTGTTTTPPPPPPGAGAVGTARIAVPTTLRPQPNAPGGTAEIPDGVVVDLLDIPDTKIDGWAKIRSKDSGEGYVRNRDLSHVATNNGQFDQWHAALSIAPSLSPDKLRDRLAWAEGVLSRSAGDASDDLRIKTADGYATLAKKASDLGAAEADCGQGTRQLNALKRGSNSQQASDIKRSCDEKLAALRIDVKVASARGDGPVADTNKGTNKPKGKLTGPIAEDLEHCKTAAAAAKEPGGHVEVIRACNDVLNYTFKDPASPGNDAQKEARQIMLSSVGVLETSLTNAKNTLRKGAPSATSAADLKAIIATSEQLSKTPDSPRHDEANGRIKTIVADAKQLRSQAQRMCGDLNFVC